MSNTTMWSDWRMRAARGCLSLTMKLAPRNHPGMTTLGCFWMDAQVDRRTADTRLEHAADRLYAIGKNNGWFQNAPADWRDADPTARDEFLHMTDQIVRAYDG